VDVTKKLQLIDKQISDAKDGHPEDFAAWKNQTEVVLRTIFGIGHPTYESFLRTRFSSQVISVDRPSDGAAFREKGVKSVLALLGGAKLELQLSAEAPRAAEGDDSNERKTAANGRVFIVHGHDTSLKNEAARFLRDLTGEDPVILHEQPDGGRSLIEKFEASAATTGYAVVLLTADDFGRAKGETTDQLRGRQNVVFEMGFFFGSLGRGNVAVIHDEGVEEPGDVRGMLYVPRDDAGAWKMRIAREIDHAGIAVEWAALGR
jgi:predicted nucleotide-binding protein